MDFVYSYHTPNTLLRIAVCSAQDTLLGKISIYEAGHTYKGFENSSLEMQLFGVGHVARQSYSECPTPNIRGHKGQNSTFHSLMS